MTNAFYLLFVGNLINMLPLLRASRLTATGGLRHMICGWNQTQNLSVATIKPIENSSKLLLVQKQTLLPVEQIVLPFAWVSSSIYI